MPAHPLQRITEDRPQAVPNARVNVQLRVGQQLHGLLQQADAGERVAVTR
jgi:hypothetical protein